MDSLQYSGHPNSREFFIHRRNELEELKEWQMWPQSKDRERNENSAVLMSKTGTEEQQTANETKTKPSLSCRYFGQFGESQNR
jgi:hypothetical protein